MSNAKDIEIKEVAKSNDDQYKQFIKDGRIEFITFHPSYSYEEFIEGITVAAEKEGIPCKEVQYVLKPGIFKNICKRALASAINMEIGNESSWKEVFKKYNNITENKNTEEIKELFKSATEYVLIIDEINRGDIAKIFGELITLLEADKRLGEENELRATLPTSRDEFSIPPNLYIIATMNTADRSIALIDVALRRRFGFIEMMPDFKLLEKYIESRSEDFDDDTKNLLAKSIEAVVKINERICEDKTIGLDRQIGHSFFFKVEEPEHLIMVWRYEILPLLQEYCYGDYSKINEILFKKPESNHWISESAGIKNIESISELKELIKQINDSK